MYFRRIPKQQLQYARYLMTAAGSELKFCVKNNVIRLSSIDVWSYARCQASFHKLVLSKRNLNSASMASCKAAASASTDDDVLGEGKEASRNDDIDMENSLIRLLYEENANDVVLTDINRCQTFEQLHSAINQHQESMKLLHRVQSIIVMWHICRNVLQNTNIDIDEKPLNAVLDGLRPHIHLLNPNELSCCYLYLRKMHAPNTNLTMQELLLQALHLIKTSSPVQETIPLTVLSRLALGIKIGRDFHMPSVCSSFMPHLAQHLANQQMNQEQAGLMSVCLVNLQPIVYEEMLQSFEQHIRRLIATNDITARYIFKWLHLFNLPVWSQRNAKLVRDLMHALQSKVPQLNYMDLKTLCKAFQHHQEPACLHECLLPSVDRMLKAEPTIESLSCLMAFAEPHRRDELVCLLKELIYSPASWEAPNASLHFFNVIRNLKISDVKICNLYWSAVLRELDASPEWQTELRFLRFCHRYMNFNNNLGGTYRHMAFEKRLSEMCMHAIEHDIAGRLPNKFARLSAFVLAYGQTPNAWKRFPNVLLSKIIAMAPQFKISDCAYISRGLQIAQELRFRYQTPSLMGMQQSTIDSVLTTCAERHLCNNEEPLTVTDVNSIVRSLSNRKYLKNSIIFKEALNKYKEVELNGQLNSRVIRDLTFNLVGANFIAPEVLEKLLDYIVQNQQHIVGDTVEKILFCAYSLGYTPRSQQALECAAAIIIRDFSYMSGLSIVQACMALSFYKIMPEELINKVFCLKFIQRVEDEIQMCYSKGTYPERVLNSIMQLNRTICLDFPEANVPWFQQNYIEAQLSKNPPYSSEFSQSVKQLLNRMLENETYFRCNHTTPYGYHIDFVIHFDQNKKPIPAPAETTMLDRITKVAILLLRLNSFCDNDLKALKGAELMKIKHLEMMGYKVLHVNEHDWNSKYLNAPGAKENYLKCLLQISS